jgi:hypothetical protein
MKMSGDVQFEHSSQVFNKFSIGNLMKYLFFRNFLVFIVLLHNAAPFKKQII